jgi:hypothetical protein
MSVIDSNLHNVKAIVLGEVRDLDSFYTRNIEIETEEGEVSFTLFSKNREPLEIEVRETKRV